MNSGKQYGYVVETPKGEQGYTLHTNGQVNGKTPVYLDNGQKILVKTSDLKVIGYRD